MVLSVVNSSQLFMCVYLPLSIVNFVCMLVCFL